MPNAIARARPWEVQIRSSDRNHQGLGNKLLTPPPANSDADGSIQCPERLGGILNHCYREAA